ncbi:MAG TPA: hypothetical protein VIX89_04955, partial [Bryobacteraceae bacterium]
PPFVTQKRSARFQFNQIDQQFDYVITNQAIDAPVWTLLGPPDPWVIGKWPERAHFTTIALITGDAPVTGLKLAHVNVMDPATKTPVGPGQLRLCRDACGSSCSGGPMDLAAHSSNVLYLCAGELPGFGNYRGQLHLAAAENRQTQAVPLNLFVSSVWAKAVGLLAMIAGVILAWFTRIYTGNKMARDYDLLPVFFQRQRLTALHNEISTVPAGLERNIAGLRSALDDWLNVRLTEAYLDARRYLHPEVPLTSRVLERRADYVAFLGQADAEVNLLWVLLMDGVRKVLSLWNPVTMPERRTDAEAALRRIDALLGRNPHVAGAQAAVKTILDALRVKLISGDERRKSELDRPSGKPVSFQRLEFRIQRESLLIWTVAGTLTTLAGLIALIFNNPGFGIPQDYVHCILWGFGIPAAAHLTPEMGSQVVGGSVSK